MRSTRARRSGEIVVGFGANEVDHEQNSSRALSSFETS
jgi:hypothetical protein